MSQSHRLRFRGLGEMQWYSRSKDSAGSSPKREALVHQHLENVSRDLLERHPELVRELIGRNAGIYALY